MDKLDAIYADVDDFFKKFEPVWRAHLLESGEKQRFKPSKLSVSEVMTIVIAFHQSGFRDFKSFYTRFVCRYWQDAFPELVSYTRMLKLMQTELVPLCAYLTQHKAKPTGVHTLTQLL